MTYQLHMSKHLSTTNVSNMLRILSFQNNERAAAVSHASGREKIEYKVDKGKICRYVRPQGANSRKVESRIATHDKR